MLNKKVLFAIIVVGIIAYLAGKSNLMNNIFKVNLVQVEDFQVTNPIPNFVALVKQVGNTVVNITVEVNRDELNNSTNQSVDNDRSIANSSANKISHIFGSGFIINSDGYIITSAHVVKNALNIKVKMIDKREFNALIIGSDNSLDIALLKINVTNLPIVKIGKPDKLQVGQWVAAIGAQFGFDNSVTQGIISAKNRHLPDYQNSFIQTDVPINPGSSGSPLFNLSGEVVAVNSQIYSRGGGYMGVSFAIPIDIVIKIVNQLKSENPNTWLSNYGIQIADLAKLFPRNNLTGIVVTQVESGSIANKAGLIVGDKIITVNYQKINQITQLKLISPLLQEVLLEVNRDGQQLFINLSRK